jgi:peptidoglycan L-alanyl-D-glutamate endopeptidase CwlK
MRELTSRDRKRLEGVHHKLVAVVEKAKEISPHDFIVTEGRRTPERQKELFDARASRTLNSRHLTGHAVDLAVLVGSEVRWDWPLYAALGHAMKEAAETLGVQLVWGGDWRSFKDGPHFELDRRYFK